jgi:hypothetical protein
MPNTRKNPKNMLVWQVITLKEVGENHVFAKSSGWIHDSLASMVLPLGLNICNENFF